MTCEYKPQYGDEISGPCLGPGCGHIRLAHSTIDGCTLCAVRDEVAEVRKRLEGVIETHHLWDGS